MGSGTAGLFYWDFHGCTLSGSKGAYLKRSVLCGDLLIKCELNGFYVM